MAHIGHHMIHHCKNNKRVLKYHSVITFEKLSLEILGEHVMRKQTIGLPRYNCAVMRWFYFCRCSSSWRHRGAVGHQCKSQGQSQGRHLFMDADVSQQDAVCIRMYCGFTVLVAFLQGNKRHLCSTRPRTGLDDCSEFLGILCLWLPNPTYVHILFNTSNLDLFQFHST